MRAKIDFISFTIPCHKLPATMSDEVQDYVQRRLIDAGFVAAWDALSQHRWSVHQARGFYRWRAQDEDIGMSVSWGNVNAHVFVELGGAACDYFDSKDMLDIILRANQKRISRLDIAADFVTDVTPAQFASTMMSGRIKTRSSVASESGSTEYVGSRTSPSMARIYRFNEPHPRHKFLRVEIELKSDLARAGAMEFLNNGLPALLASANRPYQWSHVIWTEAQLEPGAPLAGKRERAGSGQVRWLFGQVLPAMRKLQSTGQFDVATWLTSEVLPALQSVDQSAGTD